MKFAFGVFIGLLSLVLMGSEESFLKLLGFFAFTVGLYIVIKERKKLDR